MAMVRLYCSLRKEDLVHNENKRINQTISVHDESKERNRKKKIWRGQLAPSPATGLPTSPPSLPSLLSLSKISEFWSIV